MISFSGWAAINYIENTGAGDMDIYSPTQGKYVGDDADFNNIGFIST